MFHHPPSTSSRPKIHHTLNKSDCFKVNRGFKFSTLDEQNISIEYDAFTLQKFYVCVTEAGGGL